jgi:hypothetical protein
MNARHAALVQFDLIWTFAELHIDALVEDDFLWAPAELVWTVHPDEAGDWRPDWADSEPHPIPVPTIAWLSWQLLWWWSTALDDLAGLPHRHREDVTWPGSGTAAVAAIRELAAQWRDRLVALTDGDWRQPSAFPWSADAGKTVADSVLWANVELMKNVTEIGQLRLLRAARNA